MSQLTFVVKSLQINAMQSELTIPRDTHTHTVSCVLIQRTAWKCKCCVLLSLVQFRIYCGRSSFTWLRLHDSYTWIDTNTLTHTHTLTHMCIQRAGLTKCKLNLTCQSNLMMSMMLGFGFLLARLSNMYCIEYSGICWALLNQNVLFFAYWFK